MRLPLLIPQMHRITRCPANERCCCSGAEAATGMISPKLQKESQLFVGVGDVLVLGHHLAHPPHDPLRCQEALHAHRPPCMDAAGTDAHLPPRTHACKECSFCNVRLQGMSDCFRQALVGFRVLATVKTCISLNECIFCLKRAEEG